MNASSLCKNFSTIEEEARLASLVQRLKGAGSLYEKVELLTAEKEVSEFLSKPSPICSFLRGISQEYELVIKAIIAIKQAYRLFHIPLSLSSPEAALHTLLEQLLPVERFYAEIGGIVGYHWMMLRFLSAQEEPFDAASEVFHRAEGVDISVECPEVRQAILWGLTGLKEMGEIYPVGGAADRLRLYDEKTGIPLPAARLLFCGKTLLEGLVADLEAREHLYHKLFGEELLTPIAIMTSEEKDNHQQILSICEEKNWFGRPKESFRFFCQPGAPTIDKEGNWCLQGPLQLLLKPGGHGVIWKLARDAGIFDWFCSLGKKKALVRQINNPIAGVDYGLLAFAGIGLHGDKRFGFASCPRQVKSKEGTNVLIERKKKEDYEYVLTNIEYCDFEKYQIVDAPVEKGSPYSKFSSNTNILFIDLKAVEEAVTACPFPGKIVNFKKAVFREKSGETREEEIARLESMMQNIADLFVERYAHPLPEGQRALKTYLTYNKRRKTISTAKQEYLLGASLLETPEGCFLDVLHNAHELLQQCGMQSPQVPQFIFLYKPALGPLYSIIAQKLRGGNLAPDSELQLEIAELDMENVQISGSLCIHADSLKGKCRLKNVTVCNRGIDRTAPNVFWKNAIQRTEECRIVLHGDGEFEACNVAFDGAVHIDVKAGTRVTAEEKEGKLIFREEEISSPTWEWKYTLEDNEIRLKAQRA